MENYSYTASYPDSGDSSPRSREIEFENPPPWDDQLQSQNYKVKFMCSYGGKIQPRTHDNQLAYVGGETKILAVDRGIKFSSLVSKLSALCDADVSFKYQLPGEDLDALISVTNDDDLEHMMHEYDRLYRASAKPARMRLFLFAANNRDSFSSDGSRSDRERFVDALNSGPAEAGAKTAVGAAAAAQNNVDFLFGLERGMPPPPPQQPPPVAAKLHESVPEPVTPPTEFPIRAAVDDRVVGSDHALNPVDIQRELQRLQIGGHEQAVYRRKSEDNMVQGYAGEYYLQKMPEKGQPPTIPVTMPPTVPPHAGYWPEKQLSGGGFPPTVTTTPGIPEQPVYMIPATGTVYHGPPPVVRPVTAQTTQGYYTMQRMGADVYREQPVYNVVGPPPPSVPSPPVTLPPPQQPAKMAAYSEGIGMMRQSGGGGPLVPDSGPYAQMAYDSATRQLYYNTPTGGMMTAAAAAAASAGAPPPYQGIVGVSGEMKPAGALVQEGKVVGKVSQASA